MHSEKTILFVSHGTYYEALFIELFATFFAKFGSTSDGQPLGDAIFMSAVIEKDQSAFNPQLVNEALQTHRSGIKCSYAQANIISSEHIERATLICAVTKDAAALLDQQFTDAYSSKGCCMEAYFSDVLELKDGDPKKYYEKMSHAAQTFTHVSWHELVGYLELVGSQ